MADGFIKSRRPAMGPKKTKTVKRFGKDLSDKRKIKGTKKLSPYRLTGKK